MSSSWLSWITETTAVTCWRTKQQAAAQTRWCVLYTPVKLWNTASWRIPCRHGMYIEQAAHTTCIMHADIALMHFFGALDSNASIPDRSQLRPRTDDRSNRTCRTIGAFAVYMHDFGLSKFDSRFKDDQSCWNGTFYNESSVYDSCGGTVDRHYTWWCNKRPNNPCVFNCPNQVGAVQAAAAFFLLFRLLVL